MWPDLNGLCQCLRRATLNLWIVAMQLGCNIEVC